MTAQPISHDGALPRIPRTIRGIRQYLPGDQQGPYDEDWAGLDLDDLGAVARFRDKWWARAMLATNPQALADLDASRRGELEFFPSPFASSR